MCLDICISICAFYVCIPLCVCVWDYVLGLRVPSGVVAPLAELEKYGTFFTASKPSDSTELLSPPLGKSMVFWGLMVKY